MSKTIKTKIKICVCSPTISGIIYGINMMKSLETPWLHMKENETVPSDHQTQLQSHRPNEHLGMDYGPGLQSAPRIADNEPLPLAYRTRQR